MSIQRNIKRTWSLRKPRTIAQGMFNKSLKLCLSNYLLTQDKRKISILTKDHSTKRKSFVLIAL